MSDTDSGPRKLPLAVFLVVLLQNEMEVTSQFRAQGTPMGYRIDGAGRIASELTVGPSPCCNWQPPLLGEGLLTPPA